MSISPPKFEKPAVAWSHPHDAPRENTIGLAGFIVSILGLVFTCGLLSPIGLLISLAGLLSRPRGYAVAGVITGLLGSMWIVLLAGAFWVMGAVAMTAQPMIEQTLIGIGEMATTVNNMSLAKEQIEKFRVENERLPDGIEGNKLIAEFKDSQGTSLRYDVTEGGYLIRSAGNDGEFETEDDLDSTQLDSYVQGADEVKRMRTEIEKEIEKNQKEARERAKNSKNTPEIELPEMKIPEIEIPKQ
jgi:hypothetical protein